MLTKLSFVTTYGLLVIAAGAATGGPSGGLRVNPDKLDKEKSNGTSNKSEQACKKRARSKTPDETDLGKQSGGSNSQNDGKKKLRGSKVIHAADAIESTGTTSVAAQTVTTLPSDSDRGYDGDKNLATVGSDDTGATSPLDLGQHADLLLEFAEGAQTASASEKNVYLGEMKNGKACGKGKMIVVVFRSKKRTHGVYKGEFVGEIQNLKQLMTQPTFFFANIIN